MDMVRVVKKKYERSVLNLGQIAVLELVYKYRFGTRSLIGSSLGLKSGTSLYERLEVLVKNGYVGKRSDIRSKAINKPAAYYVTSKGIKVLQALPGHEHITDQAIRLSYQNKGTVRDEFIAHILNVYELTQTIERQYPTLKVFTERDISRYSYFPERLPEAFLSLPTDDPEAPHRFFFDVVRDRQPRRTLDVRLTNYVEFFDDGGWDDTESELPVILLVCEWAPSERSIQRSTRALLSRLDSTMRVYTTTANAIRNSDESLAIWTDIQDVDELISLDDISVNP
jgi:hypothetical protein